MAVLPARQPNWVQSPDQLNKAVRLIGPSSWLFVLIFAIITTSFVSWTVLGRLPVYADGPGILEHAEGSVFAVPATANGIVDKVLVKIGQSVKTGDPLVIVDQSTVRAKRDATKKQLADQQSALDTFRKNSQSSLASRKQNTTDRIAALDRDIEEQNQSLKQLDEIYAGQQSLRERGFTTLQSIQSVFSELLSTRQSLRDMRTQRGSLEDQYQDYSDQLDTQTAQFEISLAETKGTLDDLEAQLQTGGTILAPSDGVIVEISTAPSVPVASGDQLVTLEAGAQTLIARAYMPIAKGKKVEPGMRAEVSPSSVDDDIYGSILGTVTDVSDLPVSAADLQNKLGNQALVNQLMQSGAPIEVLIALTADPNTASGLDWTSSSGPPVSVGPGTMSSIRVQTEDRRPISLLIPVIRTWTNNGAGG